MSWGFGRISCIDTAINAARAAENRPVYGHLTRCEAPDEKIETLRTKIRIPSASAFQFLAVCLSSSVTISKYIEKMGPEPSSKLDKSG